jgi:hypothetical protein
MFEHQESSLRSWFILRVERRRWRFPRSSMKKRELMGLHCAEFLDWIDGTEVSSRTHLGSKKAFASCGRVRKTANYAETNNG